MTRKINLIAITALVFKLTGESGKNPETLSLILLILYAGYSHTVAVVKITLVSKFLADRIEWANLS